jgi:phosphoglycerate dehydrogenase-like enzyme
VDVLEEEPPRGRNPLLDIETCLATPHLGAATWPCLARTARSMAEDIARVLRGERPVNLVNPAALRQ